MTRSRTRGCSRSSGRRARERREELRTEARLPAGEVMELGDLRLYPIGSIGGIVRDVAGAPAAGADVRLELPNAVDERYSALFGPGYSLQQRRMQADAEGRFLYDDVPEGIWCVWAGALGSGWAHTEPRVEREGAAPAIELVLAPLEDAHLIHGIVLAAAGGPVARARTRTTGDRSRSAPRARSSPRRTATRRSSARPSRSIPRATRRSSSSSPRAARSRVACSCPRARARAESSCASAAATCACTRA